MSPAPQRKSWQRPNRRDSWPGAPPSFWVHAGSARFRLFPQPSLPPSRYYTKTSGINYTTLLSHSQKMPESPKTTVA
jgi:hypothetical protein